MEFPKPTMRKSELVKGGYLSDRECMIIYNMRNKKVARKISNASNSPIVFDTAELKKILEAKSLR